MNVALIGQGVRRPDARAKVTGRADYGTDRLPAGVAHAALVTATIAKGRIERIDTAAARAVPGVLLVMTHVEHRPVLHPLEPVMHPTLGQYPHENMPPLQGSEIHYAGQIVALVAAETPEAARQAAALVQLAYANSTPVTSVGFVPAMAEAIHLPIATGEPTDVTFGAPDDELAASAFAVDLTYTTPQEHHASMELHGNVAEWHGDDLIFHESCQWVTGTARGLAQALGISHERVRVTSPFIGAGFGGKGWFRYHSALGAQAARVLGRPVKLEMSREQVFVLGGARPAIRQRVALGADADGRLRSVMHETWSATSTVTNYQETCGYLTRQLYATRSMRTTHRAVPINIGTPCPMRAPGKAAGSFALESAMDELAWALRIDPLELRLRNYSDAEPGTGRPFSPKHLRDCYAVAAERIGWKERSPEPRGRREGDWWIGLGMSTAGFHNHQVPAGATVAVLADGSALVAASTLDLGTGTYTILSQIAADGLGLPIERVRCDLGDTDLPLAPGSGGQWTASSVGPAVSLAAEQVRTRLVRLASSDAASPLANLPDDRIGFRAGCLFAVDAPDRVDSYADLLRRNGLDRIAEEGVFTPVAAQKTHSVQCWGAQFAEVAIRASSGEVRVRRIVSAFDFGRVLNPTTARNQLAGAIVFGIGMALFEAGEYDEHSGRMTNASLGDYLLPVQADVPDIDVIMIDRPDHVANPILGVKGCGEIGTVGSAAAIANAVFNATGVRVRDLPIFPETLFAEI
ncbi:xanthine dehydrogenase family protein molybdopterin-binding subunit [Rhodopila sp.]|uniref:xanthine dehydrogenase family protein molybdopterin-binding subunit n=1 Tax=Rhodopila sp. TaxID=2480087 RepID=UPI003D12DE1E